MTRVGEVDAAVGPSELASPSLMMAMEPQGVSSRLNLLLRRGDSKVTLGHGDFLQGMEEFKALPLRKQRRTLENENFWVSSNCTLSSGIHATHPRSLLLQNVVFTTELLGSQQVTLKDKERANTDLLKRVDALSVEKRGRIRSSQNSRLTWVANWWPNEAGRANWINSGRSSR